MQNDKVQLHKISLRKIASLFCWLIVAIFVINTIAVAKDPKKTDDSMLSLFGLRPVVVVSGSMEPVIMTNSISIMQYCSFDSIKVGDIIMYRHPSLNINITHRVIDETVDGEERYLTTKGDANRYQDNLKITEDMFIGKLIATYNQAVPYINFIMLDNGEVNTFALMQIIILIAVAITVVCIVIYFIWHVMYCIFALTIGKKHRKILISTYKSNLGQQNELLPYVCALDISRGDSLRAIFGKLILAKELKAFEQSVDDLNRAYKLARFISGSDWSITDSQEVSNREQNKEQNNQEETFIEVDNQEESKEQKH